MYTKGRIRKYVEVEGRTSADLLFFTQIQVKSKIKKVISSAQWRSEKFLKGGGHNFHIFSSVFFRQNYSNLKLIEKEERH